MTEREIQEAILSVCKVVGHDSDINMEGFLALCDKLKQLGAKAEREACAKVCEELRFSEWGPTPEAKRQRDLCAAAIRERGQS
jgi:hypothetical protein